MLKLLLSLLLSPSFDSTVDVDLSAQQQCLLFNLYFEANNESLLGKIAVAQVVNQRVKCEHYSMDICGVVQEGKGEKGCAFSWLCDDKVNSIYLLDEVAINKWNENIQVTLQMTSKDPFFIQGLSKATLYHADYTHPWWADSPSVHFLGKIGTHLFYSEDNVCNN